MNTQNNNVFPVIRNEEAKKTNSIIDEILAFAVKQHKNFTAADLWNIQRQKKGLSTRQRRQFA
jgi:hypothetical protein